MKKVLCVLAVFLLVLSLLTGCATSTDNEKAVGKWQGEWDLSHTLNAMLDESLDDGENYFNFDGFKLAVIFDFEENSVGETQLSSEEMAEKELSEVFEESTKNDLDNLDIFDDFGDFDD